MSAILRFVLPNAVLHARLFGGLIQLQRRLDGRRSRLLAVNVFAGNDCLLAAETEEIVGEQYLIALVWVGRTDNERAPWKVQSSAEGKLTLLHPTLGEWQLAHAGIAEIVHDRGTDLIKLRIMIALTAGSYKAAFQRPRKTRKNTCILSHFRCTNNYQSTGKLWAEI
jgi:hypothetical protein